MVFKGNGGGRFTFRDCDFVRNRWGAKAKSVPPASAAMSSHRSPWIRSRGCPVRMCRDATNAPVDSVDSLERLRLMEW